MRGELTQETGVSNKSAPRFPTLELCLLNEQTLFAPFQECRMNSQVYDDLRERRKRMMETVESLRSLRESLDKPIKLEVDFGTFNPAPVPRPND